MIVRTDKHLFSTLTAIKGSIAKRIAWRCIMVTALASLIVLMEMHYPSWFTRVSATPFTLLGLSLSIFMSFRNNACYTRWWEGRQLWGKIIVEIRSFARESVAIADPQERQAMLRRLCGFANALNARLRGEDEHQAAQAWVNPMPDRHADNLSDAILRQLGERCSQLAAEQQISEWRYITLEQRLVGLSEAQANCERIKTTPLPFPYTLLLHRTIFIFCLLLPFAMAEPLGWLAPLFTAIVSYTFFGLDAIGNELEEPFGRDENDLPIDAMVRTIEREILCALGDDILPPPLEPIDYVLS
uniref:bestrophin family protein n=1 Tax=Halomonas sp. TaxID=1486246 RepID=UPI00260B4EB5|nr:bestrophin family protein [Halomonas sp.]